MPQKQRGASLSPRLRADLLKIVRVEGERAVAERFGLDARALVRALAGLNVLAGTIALVERGLQTPASE